MNIWGYRKKIDQAKTKAEALKILEASVEDDDITIKEYHYLEAQVKRKTYPTK